MAMVGAKSALHAQGVTSHNLANLSTTGFRADLSAFGWQNIGDDEASVRAIGTQVIPGYNSAAGPMINTGHDLDVAIQGDGWFAVQTDDGSEAYTRAGAFRLDTVNMLSLMGFETGIDILKLLAVARTLPHIVGHDVPGQLIKAGLVTDCHPAPLQG